MSRSNPFFTTEAKPVKSAPADGMEKLDFLALHWTEQLKLRPLGEQKRWEYPEGDRNNRLDNWDTDNEKEEKTI